MAEAYGSLMSNVLKQSSSFPTIAGPQLREFPPAIPEYSNFSTASSTLGRAPNETPSSGFEEGVSVVWCVSPCGLMPFCSLSPVSCHLYIFVRKAHYEHITSLWIGLFVYLLLNFRKSLCMVQRLVLDQIRNWQTFSQHHSLSFNFVNYQGLLDVLCTVWSYPWSNRWHRWHGPLIMFSVAQDFFSWMKPNLLIFCFWYIFS